MRLVEKFAFDVSVTPPVYVTHVIDAHGDMIEHVIDGTLRAMVGREHVADYLTAPAVAQALSPEDRHAISQWAAQ